MEARPISLAWCNLQVTVQQSTQDGVTLLGKAFLTPSKVQYVCEGLRDIESVCMCFKDIRGTS